MKNRPQRPYEGGYPEEENLPPNEPRGPMYHRPSYGEPAYYAAPYGGEPGDDGEGIDILKLFRVLLRRWHTVLIFVMVGGLAAWLYAIKAPKVYQAMAELEMSVRRPKVINSQAIYDDASSGGDSSTIINTRFAKFRSPAMESMAIKEYQKRYPEEKKSEKYLAYLVRRNVAWSKDKGANIVRVAMQSEDPQFAAQLVNTLTYCAGALMIQENEASSDGAVQWLDTQTEELRSTLDEVEKRLADARATAQLDSMRQRKDALGAALSEITAERSVVGNRLESRKTTYEFVLELLEKDQDFQKLPTGLPKETELMALVGKWRAKKVELENAADMYTQEHPDYQRIEKQLERAGAEVEHFLEVSASAVENEIRLLELQFGRLNKRVASMEKQAIDQERELIRGEQKLSSLERKREAADEAYRALLKRMEQARMAADETTAFTKVIRDAEIPRHPIKPNKMIVLLIGLFAGGAAGCALAFLMEFWADKIMLVGDLKDVGLNILGTIPTQKKVESRGDLATIGLKDKFSHVFEIFAGINTLVSSERYKDRSRVLLVCSVMPGEGKTITSCNLAVAAAMNGTKTLLIDGDLRRPRLARVFGVSEDHASLLEWLSGENGDAVEIESLVNTGVHEHLDIITSRPSKHVNPAELMGRGKLRELIEWARENYDRVIIDSPPLGLVGDTQALANQADSVIVVSRLGQTKKRALKFALGRLVELDAAVLGCVANDVPHSLAGMFQGGGGYGYGGYGSYKSYGREDEK